ncbi:hypothetical protein N1030_03775 [Desulfovibrio mangrovi]|uniref:hypothetical protein n=1 Tax=Desulfovibrio mangrovi TaxID=2976983 RepID=UPI002245A76A|nr:hypothetical protein [Desulfovibrio mangrovi]UZP68107.1 hypothetical protein N1030_03775 [Desulfovibrio mangrovi]
MGWLEVHPEVVRKTAHSLAEGSHIQDVRLAVLGGDADRRYLGLPDGATHMTYSAIASRFILVQFFNCLCAECLRDISEMDALRAELELVGTDKAENASESIRFIGIAVHDEARRVAAFRREQKTGFPLFVDRSGGILESMGLGVPPAVCLLERMPEGVVLQAMARNSLQERREFMAMLRKRFGRTMKD